MNRPRDNGPCAPPAVRVFLASSAELEAERSRFAEVLSEVNARPAIARRFALQPVTWERDAFGVGATIHETIKSATEFDTLHVVVLVVWNKLGDGTLQEYEDARALWDAHRRPALLAFFRRPSEAADPREIEAVVRFKRRLLAEGVATNEYDAPEEFEQRLHEQLPRCLPLTAPQEASAAAVLQMRFRGAAAASVVASAGAIFVCRTMGFPDYGVSRATVYLVLGLPVILFIIATLVIWYYHRLLEALKALWRSPDWTDRQAYEAFRTLVPGPVMPAYLRTQFATGPMSTALAAAALAIVFLAPAVGQYQCLFEEILVWDYAVGRDSFVDAAGQVASVHVDRGRRRWPFGLQDAAVRTWHAERGEVIYVYAPGRFDRPDLGPREQYRRNLGPEVFLPVQPWIYVVLMGVTLAEAAWTFVRLRGFAAEFNVDAAALRRGPGPGAESGWAPVVGAYDAFISYAKEDEPRAERLAEALRGERRQVFYAPVVIRGRDRLHQEISEALAGARWVVLLWNAFADKSEWVAFEMATHATLARERRGTLVLLDLGGPNIPAWLQPDAFFRGGDEEALRDFIVLGNERAVSPPRGAVTPGRLWRALSLCREVVAVLPAWRERARRAVPRLEASFALAHLRADELERGTVRALLCDAFLGPLVLSASMTAAMALLATAIPYPQGRGPSVAAVAVLAGITGLALGWLLMLRVGIAAGAAAATLGGIVAPVVAVVSGWWADHAAIGGGMAAGMALGAAAATAVALGAEGAAAPFAKIGAHRALWALGPLWAIATVVLGKIAAQHLGGRIPHPGAGTRAVVGLSFGALAGLPIAALVGWIAHLQARRRAWPAAARFATAVWIGLALVTGAAAAGVPFGEPGTLADRAGVGLLIAGIAALVTSVFQHGLERLLGGPWSTVAAVLGLTLAALLLLVLFPNVFPNVQGIAGYVALQGGVAGGFVAVSVTVALARPAGRRPPSS